MDRWIPVGGGGYDELCAAPANCATVPIEGGTFFVVPSR